MEITDTSMIENTAELEQFTEEKKKHLHPLAQQNIQAICEDACNASRIIPEDDQHEYRVIEILQDAACEIETYADEMDDRDPICDDETDDEFFDHEDED